jgi:RHS repeat-associated protein
MKQRKVVRDEQNNILLRQKYIGNAEFRNDTLEAVYHDDGRLTPKEDGSWQHEYVLRDHLGNTRVMFADMDNDQAVDASEILQQNHYYPFGMNQEGAWDAPTNTTENRYQYNGKELNTDFGLNLNDYGARWYDSAIGRMTTVDRFAEKYYSLSSYGYAANSPFKYIDVNGDSLEVSQLKEFDAGAAGDLIADLQSKSGLVLNVDGDGNVTYATDDDGKAVVTKNSNGKNTGSKTARKALMKLINSRNKVSVGGTTGLTRVDMDGPNPNLILFSPGQTTRQMSEDYVSIDLNRTTWGYALTFFHELGHTAYGGSGLDPSPSTGEDGYEVVGRQERLPNKIRRELGIEQYGQRVTYYHYPIITGNRMGAYFPWSAKSLRQLKQGTAPTEKYILHPYSNF